MAQVFQMPELSKITQSQIIPSRSRYQLEHFVIGQHDTPEMQYQQILIEGADLTMKIRMAELAIRKTEIEIANLKLSDDPIKLIEAEEKELGLAYTKLVLESARYEWAVLEELFKKYPNYTYAEIENNQPEYWKQRLTRQAEIDQVQAREGITAGNVASMLNAGLISRTPELENK
jgi:hypothetical protein